MTPSKAILLSLLFVPLCVRASAESIGCMQIVAVGPIERPDASLLVALPIAGLSYARFFQIDTGSYYANYLYGHSWDKALRWDRPQKKNIVRKPDEDGRLIWDAKIGGRTSDKFRILDHKGLPDSLHTPGQIAGTIGMPFFSGRKVLLDIRRRNLCIYNPAEKLENISLTWFDLHKTDLRLDAEIEIEGIKEKMLALVDTGSDRSDVSFFGPRASDGEEVIQRLGAKRSSFETFAWGETFTATLADVGRVRVFDRNGKLIKTLDRARASTVAAHRAHAITIALQAITDGKAVVFDVDAGRIGIEQ
jgi:hypothetical protein